jgi:2-haloacid dehalogenase
MITQIWRLKQLEYTWHRSLMRRYEDFSVITRDSLVYTLRALGLKYDNKVFERIMDKYVHLDLYPDARQALADLSDYKLAILSNGSTDMLTTLVRNTALDKILDATISIDSKRIFKPSPEAYSLVSRRTSGLHLPKSSSFRRTRGTRSEQSPSGSIPLGSNALRPRRWPRPAGRAISSRH